MQKYRVFRMTDKGTLAVDGIRCGAMPADFPANRLPRRRAYFVENSQRGMI
jgi:hypothetical protein